MASCQSLGFGCEQGKIAVRPKKAPSLEGCRYGFAASSLALTQNEFGEGKESDPIGYAPPRCCLHNASEEGGNNHGCPTGYAVQNGDVEAEEGLQEGYVSTGLAVRACDVRKVS